MVEEIVPFSKEFSTVRFIAGEDTSQTSCEGICKFHLAETFCVRNVNFIFEDAEINIFTVHHDHLSLLREAEAYLDPLFDVDPRILQLML